MCPRSAHKLKNMYMYMIDNKFKKCPRSVQRKRPSVPVFGTGMAS